jgi:Na+-translocating ferredoxin:NAD+ oxidoreductase subunit C
MKLFKIRGGVHPEARKELTSDKPIEPAGLPSLLQIPVQQHIGSPAEPIVKAGDIVKKGQLLAKAQGTISTPVHAPTSGEVIEVGDHPALHPSGLPIRTIVLRPDGRDAWAPLAPPLDLDTASSEAIEARIAEAGIVGMGGATFPSAVKLNLRARFSLNTLVINGAECEPYLTCDDRLMRERTAEVIDGVRIMCQALQVSTAIIAIENNKPEALEAMHEAVADDPALRVVGMPTRYPLGSEKHLVHALTGKETPAGALTANIGVVVHNVGTTYAIHEAVRLGRPLISRVVTVSGGGIMNPRNLQVAIGTPIRFLIDQCGGYREEPGRLLAGGPMMGQPLPSLDVPVVKGTNGVLALTHTETDQRPEMPCIRCGTCVSVCPCGLMPFEMASRIRHEDLEGAADHGLRDCLSCGACAYACPSHIPLVQYFNYAKGKLRLQQQEEQKQGQQKRLIEARAQRLQRQAEERKAKQQARRKAIAENQQHDKEASV